jgi:hypothetical protein
VPTPEDVVICSESVGLIRKAIRSLPLRYRDALVAYSEDRNNSAVAARFGLSTNAATSLLCRARMRLREELDRVGYAAGAIFLKLHRWQHLAATATATAAVCAVTVMGGSSEASSVVNPGFTAAARTPATQATVVPPNDSVRGGTLPLDPRSENASRRPFDDLREQIDSVRHQARMCGSSGRDLPIRYERLIRDAMRSVERHEPLLATRSPCPNVSAAGRRIGSSRVTP